MTFHERSLDDLPLAAYSTGVVPDEPEELVPDPDLVASDPTEGLTAPTAEAAAPAVAAAEAPDVAPRASRRVSLKLPALRRKRVIDAASAPFQPVHPSVAAAGSFTPVTAAPMATAPMAAAPAFAASTLSAPSYGTPSITVPVGTPTPAAKPLGVLGRKPRELLRDPRVLAGGVVAIGLALLGVSLLGGGGPSSGAAGPGSSQNTTLAQPTPVPVGAATVEQTGALKGTYELIGQTGAGPAVESQVNATWGDSTGDTLGLTGLASAGTRATDTNFVLTWSTFVAGAPIKFTSNDGECVIGMAVGPKAVSGGFVCKKLTSDDGKRTIDLKGSYRT